MYLDMASKWQAIKEHADMGFRELFPLKSQKRTLQLDSIEIKEPDASVDAQRKALVSGGSLTAAVYGNFSLIDNEKQRILDKDKVKILDLPIVTHRGTFVVQGKDYSVFNQTRLRPGVYTSKAEDSDAVASKFNLGKGLGFRVQLNADASRFDVVFDASKANTGGQAKIPLYSVLRALGASDDEMKQRWGEKLFASNVAKANLMEDIKHIVELVVYKGKRTGNDVQDIRDYFNGTQLNEDTTKVTLGHAYSKVTADTLLDATSKIIKVYNDEADNDDLDSLLYKEVLSAEDHIFLRISKGAKEPNGVLAKLRRRLDNVTLDRMGPGGKKVMGPAETVRQAVPINCFSQMVEKFYTTSSLSSPQTEINPIEILETNHKITAMGEGGISSEHGIPMSARNLHTSHFGFLDPVRTTESTRVGVDLRMTAQSFVKNRNIYSKFIDRNGKEVSLRPVDLNGKVVAFSGQEGETVIKALHNGDNIETTRDKVDYWMEKPSDMFTYTSNMVPFLHNDQGNRVTMASRMVTQAVPLTHREAPLVQVKASRGKHDSYEKELGTEYFSPKAPEDGTVKEVNEKFIRVNNTKVDIYSNFPLNYKSVTGSTEINILKPSGSIWRGRIADYQYDDGDKVQSINTLTKRSAWMKVNGYLKLSNDKRLYRVLYKSGRHVDVTEDHSLITLDDAGELTPILPKDCVVGKTMSPIAMIPSIETTSSKYALGELVGLYLAEGHLSVQAGLVCIAVQDKERQSAVLDLIKRVNQEFKPYVNGGNVCFTDHDFSAFLLTNCGRLSGNKFISTKLFNNPESFRKGLISGYLGGDGVLAVGKKGDIQVWAASTSKQLRNDMVDMLASVGVFTTIRNEQRTKYSENWNDAYAFRICSSELSKLDRWFFYDDREAKLRANLKGDFRSSRFYNVPVTKEARKVVNASFDGITPHFVSKSMSAKDYVAKHRMLECKSTFGDWARSDVMWDTIVDIVEISKEDYVYDIEVDKSNVFAVNGGLVVHNTYIHMTPLVHVGDKVHKGQILAESNFTKNGTLAIGTNLRVAYIPYKGWNHEDGIVVSETAAKKLTSQHMYIKELDLGPEVEIDKRKLAINFPSKINAEQLRKLDEEGIAIKGQVLNRGDYVIAALAKREPTTADALLTRMHASLANPYKDASLVWDHDRPGTVTDIVKTNSLVKVILRTEDESRVGDKLTGRHGNKGTITMILPDNEMPYDKEGRPMDILLNPAGVISRVNPGQLYDTMAGKLAEKQGKPYLVENFSPEDSSKKVLKQMSDAGVSPEEALFDPKTKQKLGDVFIGNQYTLKLHKQTEGNFAARSTHRYDTNLQPAKGGEEGAKAIGLQDFYALLGHNARNNLREMAAFKSQKNTELWNAIQLGTPLPPAKETFAFEKFKGLLGATGIHVEQGKDIYQITPMTDKHVMQRSAGEIKSGLMLKGNVSTMVPEDGGLFDKRITGGLHGNNWTHVDLAEPIVHPLFSKVVKTLINKDPNDITGHEAHQLLSQIDVDKRLAELRAELQKVKGSSRDKVIKQIKYLNSLKQMGMKPSDYVLTKFPIIPPQYRPIYPSPSGGSPMVSDLNNLYRDLINTNEALKELHHFPDEDKKELRASLNQAAGAVIGITDPINVKSKKQEAKGALKVLTGNTAKDGYFHRKIMYRTQDSTGRGTILPNPNLHVDEVEIPKDMAFQLFKPFVVNNMVKKGVPMVEALKHVADQTHASEIALKEEMGRRPVILNRAPTLHKYNVLAFKPKAIEGKSIFIPPLVIKGFNADFDGDSVSGDTYVMVQVGEEIQLKQIREVE